MRRLLLPPLLALFAAAAVACGDDDGGGVDEEAACQESCEAEFADDLAACEPDICSVEYTFDETTGSCECIFNYCDQDLCTDLCQETEGTSGTCQFDACVCD